MQAIIDVLGDIMREVRESGWRERRSLSFDPEKGRTKQQFRDEVNINEIMRRYRDNAIVPETRGQAGHYGDFSDIGGYDEAMEAVNTANQAFVELPSHVRTRFGNDPAQLLLFMEDEGNEEEARALGILPPLEVEPEPELEELAEPGPGGEGDPPEPG